MTQNKIIELLKLNNSYQNWKKKNVKIKFLNSINLLNNFSSVYNTEINKLPYRLNLLDDLSTNENAHSKFLIRLLQYQPALIHFLTFINNNETDNFTFDVSIIKKPILTYEKLRIDGLIRENNKYAIIIENKIHNAVEQEHQIGRYIDKCKSIGFNVQQIFIIYLTKTERDNHSEQTWGNQYSLANFNKRYSKLSYKSKILFWLENYITTLSPKEELIKSAIVQYIDHLKHFFNKKEIYSNMNVELQKFLATALNLNEDNVENIDIVERKIIEIGKLKEQLEDLAKNTKKKLFEDWEENLKNHFEFTEYKKFNQAKDSFIKTGVIIEYEGQKFSVLIEYNYKSIYFGFGRHFASEKLEPKVKEFLESIIQNESLKVEEPWWYGWKYTSFNNGYLELENLIQIVKEKISASK